MVDFLRNTSSSITAVSDRRLQMLNLSSAVKLQLQYALGRKRTLTEINVAVVKLRILRESRIKLSVNFIHL